MTDTLAGPRSAVQLDTPSTGPPSNNSPVPLDEGGTVRTITESGAQVVRWFRAPDGRWSVVLISTRDGERSTVVGWAPAETTMTIETAEAVVQEVIRVERDKSYYPLPLPADGRDSRFTKGLVLDVGELLARHGYPALRPLDLGNLQQCLFRMIYDTGRVAKPEPREGNEGG